MPIQTYHDYRNAEQSRKERAEQLRQQYDQKPQSVQSYNFWAHNIERHSATNEGRNLIFVIVGALLATVLILNYL